MNNSSFSVVSVTIKGVLKICALPLGLIVTGCTHSADTKVDNENMVVIPDPVVKKVETTKKSPVTEAKQENVDKDVVVQNIIAPVVVKSDVVSKLAEVKTATEVSLKKDKPEIKQPRNVAPVDSYMVQRGDTLYRIAKKLFDSPARWKEIYDLNRDQLSKPEALDVGMNLKVPAGGHAIAVVAQKKNSVVPKKVVVEKKVVEAKPLKKVVPVSTTLTLLPEDFVLVGERIYRNECSSNAKYLTAWNKGEEFPSFGIGHFIWFPAGIDVKFEETFPQFISFMQAKGVSLPALLMKTDAPWNSREEFLADFNSPEMIELRVFLENNISYQTEFIIRRAQLALPQILKNVSANERAVLQDKYYRVAQSKGGLYPLIDYVNFKGEGISDRERYKGQGWGLLQVLEQMRSNTPVGTETLEEFYNSACFMLELRVINSPVDRNEQKWLAGWKNRLKTYLPVSIN